MLTLPGSCLQSPTPCTTLASETLDPRERSGFIGFQQKAGGGGWWSLDLGPPPS